MIGREEKSIIFFLRFRGKSIGSWRELRSRENTREKTLEIIFTYPISEAQIFANDYCRYIKKYCLVKLYYVSVSLQFQIFSISARTDIERIFANLHQSRCYSLNLSVSRWRTSKISPCAYNLNSTLNTPGIQRIKRRNETRAVCVCVY